jgi:hypothetical protein
MDGHFLNVTGKGKSPRCRAGLQELGGDMPPVALRFSEVIRAGSTRLKKEIQDLITGKEQQ